MGDGMHNGERVQECLRRALSAPVYELARRTPLDQAPKLSQRIGRQLWLKREDLQPTISFKLRGAYNKLRCLSEEERQRGVIAASNASLSVSMRRMTGRRPSP